jgi:hypothetical protein
MQKNYTKIDTGRCGDQAVKFERLTRRRGKILSVCCSYRDLPSQSNTSTSPQGRSKDGTYEGMSTQFSNNVHIE